MHNASSHLAVAMTNDNVVVCNLFLFSFILHDFRSVTHTHTHRIFYYVNTQVINAVVFLAKCKTNRMCDTKRCTVRGGQFIVYSVLQ